MLFLHVNLAQLGEHPVEARSALVRFQEFALVSRERLDARRAVTPLLRRAWFDPKVAHG